MTYQPSIHGADTMTFQPSTRGIQRWLCHVLVHSHLSQTYVKQGHVNHLYMTELASDR
eukprot:CAMPEP_0202904224 /NCGR_PEP_ID=MMETSP1392-20130828/28374_1 /ASSEMBLY_ACC=CAM_ASM_000868 /TAXON_ID=225041 /ORGANISM="Chlamydomonas chlamydogama, Strain SAG 11-48b" /LENGTH=57 /DNA_ID=CAMNT_0049591753 /DNA_START=31 /DNA_END=204 /DNA_ORIENTATION=-